MDTLEHCCTDVECTSGLRNNYFRGKHLTPRSYEVEQRYHIERRKLLNRALHGHGVAYGYKVTKADSAQFKIGDGLAIDECGREVLQVGSLTLAVKDVIVLKRDGHYVALRKGHEDNDRVSAWINSESFLLSVHYAERQVGPLDLRDPCSCSHREWDQVCETVRYSLRPVARDSCCKPQKCKLDCACTYGPCCPLRPPMKAPAAPPVDRHVDHEALVAGAAQVDHPNPAVHPAPGVLGRHPEPVHTAPPRGGCRCLCDYVTGLNPNVECEPFCEIEEPCARVRVDLGHGVPLACVTLRQSGCDWNLEEIYDDCGPRDIIKGNDLLFELIQGCDLTYVEKVGWESSHRGTMTFDAFRSSFGDGKVNPLERWPNGTIAADPGRDAVPGTIARDYWVTFSKPVRVDTLRPDSFVMTVVLSAQEAAWGKPRRVPIVDVIALRDDTCPPYHARTAILVFDTGWVSQHLGNQPTFTHCSEIFVEIGVRATYILDCNDQRPDLRVWGHRAAPTGRGESGADLISTFHVDGPNTDARRQLQAMQA